MRRNSYSGKYKLTKIEYYCAHYYALQYDEWKARYNILKGSMQNIDHNNTTGTSPAETVKEEYRKLQEKIELVEQTAMKAGGDIYPYILKAVTSEDITYHHLKTVEQIPCEKNTYYDRRRKFYWLLAQKI